MARSAAPSGLLGRACCNEILRIEATNVCGGVAFASMPSRRRSVRFVRPSPGFLRRDEPFGCSRHPSDSSPHPAAGPRHPIACRRESTGRPSYPRARPHDRATPPHEVLSSASERTRCRAHVTTSASSRSASPRRPTVARDHLLSRRREVSVNPREPSDRPCQRAASSKVPSSAAARLTSNP